MTMISFWINGRAPGNADLPQDHPDLWPVVNLDGAEAVILWLCERLNRAPNEIALRQSGFETEVYAMEDRDARPNADNRPALFAVVWEGATFLDLTAARKALVDPERAAA